MGAKVTMPILKAGTSNNRGFTFIEISVVLFIIGLFAAMALPRLTSFLSTAGLNESSSKIAIYLEHMRDESVYKRKTILLKCDLDKKSFSALTVGEESKTTVLLRPYKLPDDVKIIDINVGGRGKVSEGEATISFYPGGRSESAFIHIRDNEDQDMTLELSPFSRAVRIHDGYAEKS